MSKIIKKKSFFILNLSFILFFSFCSKKIENYKDVFRYNEYSNISSLDPAFSSTLRNIWPCNQLFNGLVKMDENLNVVPDLAEYWTVSNDKKEYSFKIRDDIYFHESEFFKNKTRKVNAFDFEYSFSRIIDENIASPGSWVMNNVESFKAINDSIFEIKLHFIAYKINFFYTKIIVHW